MTAKFSSQMEAAVLQKLRNYAKQNGQTLSRILTEAANDWLQKQCIRPAFREQAQVVMQENEELLRRLAQ